MPVSRTPDCSPDHSPEMDDAAAGLAGARRRGPSLEKTTQTQRQITEAALAEFLEQGIARSTMAQIASRAGVAKGTIYSYYPSKDSLLRGVVEHSLAQSAAYLPLCRQPGESPEALLRRSLQPTMRSWEQSHGGELARLIVTEGKHHPELTALYKELAFDPWQRHVHALLQLACDEGALYTPSVAHCAQLLASPFWMGMVHNGLLVQDPQQHVAIGPLVDQLITVLFAAPAPQGALPAVHTAPVSPNLPVPRKQP